MHELSIAQNIVDIAIKECKKVGGKKINCITLKLGKAAGVNIKCLLFAFNVVKEGSIAENAVLNYEEVDIEGTCMKCKKFFKLKDWCMDYYIICCPLCGSLEINLCKGKELEIYEIDVE